MSQVWKDTKDSEFVRKTNEHSNLNSTAAKVTSMDDEESKKRIASMLKNN